MRHPNHEKGDEESSAEEGSGKAGSRMKMGGHDGGRINTRKISLLVSKTGIKNM